LIEKNISKLIYKLCHKRGKMEAFNLFKLILIGVNLIAIVLISAFAIKSSFSKIREFEKDKLTGILNKKSFLKHLNNKIKRSNKKPLSLVALDINDLNKYNRNYGYIKGNNALKEVKSIIKENIKSTDIICRENGRFFIASDEKHENAIKTAEILRKKLQNYDFYGEGITTSIGLITSYGEHDPETLLKNTDELIVSAKSNGKNIIKAIDLKMRD